MTETVRAVREQRDLATVPQAKVGVHGAGRDGDARCWNAPMQSTSSQVEDRGNT